MMSNLQTIFKRKGTAIGSVSILIIGLAIILFLLSIGKKDKFNVDALYSIIGLQKQAVLDKLDILNAEVKTLGVEEHYTTKIGTETVSVIFTNGLCSGYSRKFNDVNTAINGLNKTIKKLDKLYGNKLPSVAPNVKLSSFLNNTEGIKSMKISDRYFEQWNLPRNSESEKILLGEKVNEFNGLNIELSLSKSENDYIVTVRYVANRNK